ncbi:hypothetical protein FJY68_06755 [candidate division WOR-3 bacterium]|uniref:CARDB domain-containing protein n=1 Tax=candidate division WOR-3 bacterium TaxID=2052148 RepID=A0A937XH45_UNCW3|nr:hypothetical protein [candidate division WOR-3 bacterium]
MNSGCQSGLRTVRRARQLLALFAVIRGSTIAQVTAYDVRPVKSSLSGWTRTVPGQDYVSQLITCNFDSLSHVELFVGELGSDGGGYHVGAYEGGIELTGAQGVQHQPRSWVRFENWSERAAFTRGRQYEFRFTRSEKDSIHYHYDSACEYNYGHMIAPHPTLIPPSCDLAMRVYGRTKTVARSFWGGFAKLPPWNGWDKPNRRDSWRTYMSQTGWGTAPFDCNWEEHQPTSDAWHFEDTEAHISLIRATGAQPVGILVKSPLWGSSRQDSTWVPDGDSWIWGYGPVAYGASRNLWPDSGETNYYACWIDSLLNHADSVHTWIVWNEPNDTTNKSGSTGWWRRPNYLQYESGFDGLRGLCLLYMRMCYVANQRLRRNPAHAHDRLLVGAMHRDTFWNDTNLVSGVDWLDMCYKIAKDSNWGIFWDGVAVHPYQEQRPEFSPEDLEFSAETLRAVMRGHGDDDGELWNSEFGWNRRADGFPRAYDANNLCEAYVTSLSLSASLGAGGGYDRLCWWVPYWPSDSGGRKPVEWNWLWLQDDADPTDSVSLLPQSGYYAFKQSCAILVGRRFNRRVVTGDTAVDNHARIYEFEDTTTLQKRTWVCWADGDMKRSIRARLPVRTDQLAGESLAYSSKTPTFTPRVADDGWLSLDLNTRPIFIHEVGSPERPDLRVDSVRFVSENRSVRAWVTNHGTRATPVRSGRLAYPTWAVLKADGDSVGQAVWSKSAGENQGVDFGFELGRTELPDTVLLSVTVNPEQSFVELETDDNTGYTLIVEP